MVSWQAMLCMQAEHLAANSCGHELQYSTSSTRYQHLSDPECVAVAVFKVDYGLAFRKAPVLVSMWPLTVPVARRHRSGPTP